MMEFFKHASDKLLIWFLKSTSGFCRELTKTGREEQRKWRELRLRDLKGLAIRSRRRFSKSTDPA